MGFCDRAYSYPRRGLPTPSCAKVRGLVDRRRDGSGQLVRLGAGMDGQGVEGGFAIGHGGMVAGPQRDTFAVHVFSSTLTEKDPQMASAAPETAASPTSTRDRILAWKEILETANPPATRPLDTVGKWLVITRAAVFPMTIWSGLIGGLLAVEAARTSGGAAVDWGLFLHRRRRPGAVACGEQHDQRLLRLDRRRRHGGLRAGAVRAAPDPVGLGDQGPAAGGDPLVNVIDGAIMLYLAAIRGPLIIVVRTGRSVRVRVLRRAADPPQAPRPGRARRVHRVGPADDRRHVPRGDRRRSRPGSCSCRIPYALIVTSVLFGKHIDKIEADTKLGVRTLPVILGEARARRRRTVADDRCSTRLTVLFVAIGWIGPWVLLIVLALPRLVSVLRIFAAPKPASPPDWYPATGWPLWFVGFAFTHTRRAGGLLTLGLLLNALVPITLPWL